MIHFSAPLRRILTFILVFGVCSALRAQLPVNDNVWRDRCNLLAASAAGIQNGTPPRILVEATRGVPARGFFVLAVNRAQANQHYVACTMYYLAAIAERVGNGSQPSSVAATNDAIVAGSEAKLAHGHHLDMQEHLKRVEMKVEEITGKPLDLTPDQTTAVLNAASTMPISLAP